MLRHQVLTRLAARFAVVWLEPPLGWRQYLSLRHGRFLHADQWSTPVVGLDVLRPGFRHPTVIRPIWATKLAFKSRLATARKQLLERGAERIALYIWRPQYAAALELIHHDWSCYHIDDEYSFSEQEVPTPADEKALIGRVDHVIVHSAKLLEKKGGINPHTTLIPNGVDYAAFSLRHVEPNDLRDIPHPRIGYAGVIKRQLNLKLLLDLARRRSDLSFVLVGPVMNVSGKEQLVDALRGLPNVYFLGPRPAEMLPSYVQFFDVCLMCYEVNDYTKYIYPLKLHEYLASGQPVVSSPIDSVLPFSNVVAIAGSEQEWLQAIDQSLEPDAREATQIAIRQNKARTYDWERIVERIGHIFEGA